MNYLAIAIDAFKDILIELQSSLLSHLLRAQDDDSMTDFSGLIDVSDNGRVKAVRTLCDLYMRCATKAPIVKELPEFRPASSAVLGQLSLGGISKSPARDHRLLPVEESTSPANFKSLADDRGWQGGYVEGSVDGSEASIRRPTLLEQPSRNYDGSSLLTPRNIPPSNPAKPKRASFFKRLRSSSSRQEEAPQPVPPASASPRLSIQSTIPSESASISTSQNQEGLAAWSPSEELSQDNPNSKPSSSIALANGNNGPSADFYDNPWRDTPSHPVSNEDQDQSRSNINQPQLSQTQTNQTTSTGNPTPNPASCQRILTVPSASNGYAGFCKGAFALQVGTKDAMKLRKQVGPFQSMAMYWACGSKKCAFEGQAVQLSSTPSVNPDAIRKSGSGGGGSGSNSNSNEYGFETHIRTLHGVRFRWTFLAKSHVTQGRVVHGIYNYRCIFCVLVQDQQQQQQQQQHQEVPVYQRMGTFIEHVARHKGEELGEAVLQRACCVQGRWAAEEEEGWDINFLLPASEDENENGIGMDHQRGEGREVGGGRGRGVREVHEMSGTGVFR